MTQHLTRTVHRLARLACGIVERQYLSASGLLHQQTATCSRILSISSMRQQDRHHISELPIVQCRVDPSMFPFLERIPRVETLESEQDKLFKSTLQKCSSLQDVFQLLEIPTDTVSGYAAAYALQRICQLPHHSDGERQSFISTAILNELCETVAKDIDALGNDSIINLTLCCSRMRNTPQYHVDRVFDEVEKRVGEEAFSIHELCMLIEIILNDPLADQSLANNIWMQIGQRKQDIVAENIAFVYSCVKYFSREYEYMLAFLSEQFSVHWWKLNNSEMVTIANSLTKFGKDISVLKYFGRWLLMNIHSITDDEMKAFVSLFTHFNYYDESFKTSLEKYMSDKRDQIDITLIGMIQNYFRTQRYLSTVVMDAVASHFAEHGSSYEPFQILLALKPFGELNYMPSALESYKLFSAIERVLFDKFADFNFDQMLQILTSFVYVERFPINFVNRIFTPHYISKIRYLEDLEKERATTNLQYLYTALIQETSRAQYSMPYRGHKFDLKRKPFEGCHLTFFMNTRHFLKSYLGIEYFDSGTYAANTPHFMEFCVHLDENRTAVKFKSKNKYDGMSPNITRLAILLQMPEYYCVNSKHLLGEYAMRNRHLRLMGYDILELEYDSSSSIVHRKKYITKMITSSVKSARLPKEEVEEE